MTSGFVELLHFDLDWTSGMALFVLSFKENRGFHKSEAVFQTCPLVNQGQVLM